MRLPRKPLLKINGKSIICHVFDRAISSKVGDVYVATGDKEIYDNFIKIGGNSIITKKKHITGTDRIYEALMSLNHFKYDYILNIQGDEPLINPEAIDKLILSFSPNGISNAYVRIDQDYKSSDVNVVKVAFDKYKFATHFSRLPISDYQQLGLYAFSRDMLSIFPTLPVGEFEQQENVEMLRYVENGFKLKMVEVDDDGLSVDTPNDLKLVELKIGGYH